MSGRRKRVVVGRLPEPRRGRHAAAVRPVLLAALLLAAFSARAQVPDSLAAPADSLAVPSDTLEASPDRRAASASQPVVGFAAWEPGTEIGGVPARRPVLSAAEMLAEVPGAFHYALGVAGGADGVALGGLPPHRTALALDGLPAEDLFSGRPAYDLLPLEAVAPLRLAPGRYGEPAAVQADVRGFAASVPLTELRYWTGPGALQYISATHAQTRRPAFLQRIGGGERARLAVLFHVAGRDAEGDYANFDAGGWHLVGRVGLLHPRFSLEVSERHARRRAGASGGLGTRVFDEATPVLDADAERETIWNTLAATLRVRLFPQPLTLSGYWTAETYRYTDAEALAPALRLEAVGDRYGVRLAQPFRVGPHRLQARLDGWLDATGGVAFGTEKRAANLHLALRDSLDVAGWALALEAGLHAAPEARFPTAFAEAQRALGPVTFDASARYAGARYARMERDGFGTVLRAEEAPEAERTLALETGAGVAFGAFDLALRLWVTEQRDPRLLLDQDTTALFVTGEGAFRRAVASFGLGWRMRAARGLYAQADANAYAFLNPDASELHRREAEALPELWGRLRLGARARGLFENALDLDLAVRLRGWTAFRGRTLHAPTALFALPPADAERVEASGTLDVLAEAGIGGGRATVFVVYENALADRLHRGAYTVPVYPLPGPRLRFGVFWLLPY